MSKKLIIGITAAGSVGLLEGQLTYFREKGFETYLMAPADERSIEYCKREQCTLLNIKIEREISLFKDFSSLFQIISHIKRIRPDIVNFGTPKVSLLGLMASRFYRVKKRIYTCRGLRYEHEVGLKRSILKLMERITGSCSHHIICISESVKDLALRDKLFSENKCIVINKGSSNGIDLKRFQSKSIPENEKTRLKESLGISNSFIYGFIGRIIDRKGINELYLAFSNIYSKDNTTRLLITGPFEESQIRDKELKNKLLAHPGIILTGRTDNVPLYLSVLDVFVLPAWWEGFGNVLIQAAAMEIPVISTYGTGTKDAVAENYNGLLVAVRDESELENAMFTLRNNPEKLKIFAKNGIEWAKNFDREIIWKGMENIYQ